MTPVTSSSSPERPSRARWPRGVGARLLLGASLFGAVGADAETPAIVGFARAGGGSFDSAPSFLAGDFGKLLDGDLPREAAELAGTAELRLALDWEPAIGWRLFVHGVARVDSAGGTGADGSGLLEAFVERTSAFGEGEELGLRVGQFFLPTSRENVGPLWTSPYTLTLSALNSWIAEEVRPIGLDVSWRHTTPSEHRFDLAGTLFGGNDTSGALLAWRGFAQHDRPTPTGREIRLPPLAVLATTFPDQATSGSEPFGGDLDGRPGYAGRARWSAPGGRATVQATAWLNDGDRDLHGDQYAWETDFRWLSAEVDLGGGLALLGEWATVTSRMGFDPQDRRRAQVDIVADTFYLLATWSRGPLRLSARFDDFVVRDRDRTPGDNNSEEGQSVTLALLARFGEHWRAGAEFLSLDAERPAARVLGRSVDGQSFRIEVATTW